MFGRIFNTTYVTFPCTPKRRCTTFPWGDGWVSGWHQPNPQWSKVKSKPTFHSELLFKSPFKLNLIWFILIHQPTRNPKLFAVKLYNTHSQTQIYHRWTSRVGRQSRSRVLACEGRSGRRVPKPGSVLACIPGTSWWLQTHSSSATKQRVHQVYDWNEK